MTVNINKDQTTITFKVSSEIFSFNTMIERCRSFLFNLGYTEMSSMYIVLRELVFNTIITVANNDETCLFECTIELASEGRFRVSMEKIEGCDQEECFHWISRNNQESSSYMDRGNTLIHSNSDSIEINTEYNSITVYVNLTKTGKNMNPNKLNEVDMVNNLSET